MGTIKTFLATTKGKIIAGCSAAALVAVVGVVVAVIISKNGYRSIAVEDVKGTVNVVGEKNNGQAYKGERLYSGDDVTVLSESELTMCMNNDKYVYADENTHFRLESNSSKKSSKIKIVLDQGSELNVLTQKLGVNDSYDVDTPNSTMSVRGTTFRVTVYKGDDGFIYTLVEVEKGVVLAKLKTLSGTYNGLEQEINAGEAVLIRANGDMAEFVLAEDGNIILLPLYDSLPQKGVAKLQELIKKPPLRRPKGVVKLSSDDDDNNSNGGNNTSSGNNTASGNNTNTNNNNNNSNNVDNNTASNNNTASGNNTNNKDPKDGKDGKNSKDQKDNKDNKNTASNNNTSNNNNSNNNSSSNSGSGTASNNNTSNNNNSGGGSNNNQSNGGNNNNTQTTHTHSFGDWKVVKEATCSAEGQKERTCSCGEKETQTIPKKEHTWKEVIDTQPTCGKEGKKHNECTVCGEKSTSETIAATGNHNWKTVTTPETCGKDGETHEECTVCGKTQNAKVLPATGKHNWKTVTTPETCAKDGETHEECTVCGKTQNSTVIPANGKHNYVEIIDKQPTCADPGSKHEECTVCGDKKGSVTIPATGRHTMTTVTDVEPTCDGEGAAHDECSVCHGEKQNYVTLSSLGHDWQTVKTWVTDDPASGPHWHIDNKCSRCGSYDGPGYDDWSTPGP